MPTREDQKKGHIVLAWSIVVLMAIAAFNTAIGNVKNVTTSEYEPTPEATGSNCDLAELNERGSALLGETIDDEYELSVAYSLAQECVE